MVLLGLFLGHGDCFVASNRLLMKVGKDQSGLSQHCLKVFYANPNSFVSTMLVGNNIVLVVYGILFAASSTAYGSWPASATTPRSSCSTPSAPPSSSSSRASFSPRRSSRATPTAS